MVPRSVRAVSWTRPLSGQGPKGPKPLPPFWFDARRRAPRAKTCKNSREYGAFTPKERAQLVHGRKSEKQCDVQSNACLLHFSAIHFSAICALTESRRGRANTRLRDSVRAQRRAQINRLSIPKGLHPTAQGRAPHPGIVVAVRPFYAEGVAYREMAEKWVAERYGRIASNGRIALHFSAGHVSAICLLTESRRHARGSTLETCASRPMRIIPSLPPLRASATP
jgi:hypothetical protein